MISDPYSAPDRVGVASGDLERFIADRGSDASPEIDGSVLPEDFSFARQIEENAIDAGWIEREPSDPDDTEGLVDYRPTLTTAQAAALSRLWLGVVGRRERKGNR